MAGKTGNTFSINKILYYDQTEKTGWDHIVLMLTVQFKQTSNGYIQYRNFVGKYKFYLYKLQKQVEK